MTWIGFPMRTIRGSSPTNKLCKGSCGVSLIQFTTAMRSSSPAINEPFILLQPQVGFLAIDATAVSHALTAGFK